MGFATAFRFGNPFFLGPNVDELVKRFQVKDNFSIVRGSHTIKLGGEWIHTNNAQVFRGFFQGRYLFDSVTGFLRYASPAAARRLRAVHRRLLERQLRDGARDLPGRVDRHGGPLLLYLQSSSPDGIARGRGRRVGHQQRGVRALHPGQVAGRPGPDAQLRAALGCAAHAEHRGPEDDRLRRVPERSPLPLGRHDPRPVEAVPAAAGPRLGHEGERQVGAPRQRRHLLRAAEHAEPGRLGHHQRHPAAERLPELWQFPRFGATCPPGRASCRRVLPAGTFPLFTGVRVFAKDYRNPRINSANVAYEQELAPDWSVYVDFT